MRKALFIISLVTVFLFVVNSNSDSSENSAENPITSFCSPTPSLEEEVVGTGELRITYIDIGQGDATLLYCDGEYALIDGGDADRTQYLISYLQKNTLVQECGFRYLFASHYDADHISGLVACLAQYSVDAVICPPDYGEDSRTYRSFIERSAKRNLIHPAPGETLALGSAEITVLGPSRTYEEANDNSLILRIVHGNNTFMFTGDAGNLAERDFLQSIGSEDISVDVYKVGHHGSSDASSLDFLQALMPQHAIISCGAGNDYGHPHDSTIDRLRNFDCEIYRTDLQGDIVVISDGESLLFHSPPIADTPEDSSPEIKNLVLNTNSKKYHETWCASVAKISPKNYREYYGSVSDLDAKGYTACKICFK